jgi:ACT domain-containing protein
MKKTKKNKELLLEQLRKTPIIQLACEKTGISRAAFYRWKDQDKNFAKDIEEAILTGCLLINDLAESQLIGAVKDRNLSAITYWLKHHHQSYKTRVEIEGSISAIQELNPEQKALVEKALALANITINKHE